ncbi:MAG: TlpA disulfide reductase family protein [Pseudomonadota bacterium]
MPHLRDLQAAFQGSDFEVLTIATGRNDPMGMRQFLESIDVDNLPLHRDPRSALARDMAVLGLPVTVVLDRDGTEIARMQGDANWAGESAFAIVQALIDRRADP